MPPTSQAATPKVPVSAVGIPSPRLYNLASHAWTTVTLDASAADLCHQRWEIAGGCWVVGPGRSSIEFELNCYYCTNAYALQPIPSDPSRTPPLCIPAATAVLT
jgi:hypothetical protein